MSALPRKQDNSPDTWERTEDLKQASQLKAKAYEEKAISIRRLYRLEVSIRDIRRRVGVNEKFIRRVLAEGKP